MGKLICGKNSVLDSINNNVDIETLYVLKPFVSDNKKINIKVISKQEMDQMTSLNHQGFVAILAQEFNYYPIDQMIRNKPNVILILDHIEDPHNLGAIIRSANAGGVTNIIIPKNRAVEVNETAIRISSGGIVNMNIAKVNSLSVVVDKLKDSGYWVYATAIEKGVDYDKVNFNLPLVIIIGNENKGVSRSLLKNSDQNVFIPMKGTVQSLNASVAAGIIIFKISKLI